MEPVSDPGLILDLSPMGHKADQKYSKQSQEKNDGHSVSKRQSGRVGLQCLSVIHFFCIFFSCSPFIDQPFIAMTSKCVLSNAVSSATLFTRLGFWFLPRVKMLITGKCSEWTQDIQSCCRKW